MFDSIIGYESTEAGNNPNFTRSWGHTIEPSTHTGILASYRINNMISVAAGVANTLSATINGRANPPKAESYKTYMGSIALTAPTTGASSPALRFTAELSMASTAASVADQTSLYVWFDRSPRRSPVCAWVLRMTMLA